MSIIIFDSEIAKKFGVNTAIIYEYIRFNRECGEKNIVCNKNSFPFLRENEIVLSIIKLKSLGLIKPNENVYGSY